MTTTTASVLLCVLLVGCGSVTASQSPDGAAGAAAAGSSGTAGDPAGGSSGSAGATAAAGSSGAGVDADAPELGDRDVGAELAPPHPDEGACPSNTYLWGTRCPNKYDDGTICVLGCIANNAGETFDPDGGACFTATPDQYQGTAICLSRTATCSQCP